MEAFAHRLRSTVDPYRPLKLREDEIRLVKVLPTAGDIIECSVWHAQQSSTYTCLSYRCGNSKDGSKLIRVNGKPYRVLNNLWDFLDLARRTLTDEALWIDALSINQRDSREKATQVSRMGIIFSSCKHTRVWLGKSEDAQQLYRDPEQRALTGDLDLITRLIGDNVYWLRAWIVQEVLLSTRRTIHISDVSIEWEMLQALYGGLVYALNTSNRYVGLSKDEKGFLESRAILFLRQLLDGNVRLESQSFRQLLKIHGYTRCTLWQDHVFALLPLSAGGATFSVDYNASVYEVFFETLRSFNHGQCLCWADDLAYVLKIRPQLPIHEITGVDLKKLMQPMLEVRVDAYRTSPSRPQTQEDCSRHRIDLSTILPFDALLDIELAWHRQSGSQQWRCICIYALDRNSDPRRFYPVTIDGSATCFSIDIVQTESTPTHATPLILRLSQLAFLRLLANALRGGHTCSSYRWKDDHTVNFCT